MNSEPLYGQHSLICSFSCQSLHNLILVGIDGCERWTSMRAEVSQRTPKTNGNCNCLEVNVSEQWNFQCRCCMDTENERER